MLFLSLATSVSAQSSGGGGYLIGGLLVIAAIILIMIIVNVADHMMHIEGQRSNMDSNKIQFFPSLGKFFAPAVSKKAEESDAPLHYLNKGYDIQLQGAAEDIVEDVDVTRYAVQPKNFIGMSPIPKLTVAVGDEVKAGQPLFYDKVHPDVMYVSPVSGELIEVNRAEKRSIAQVVVLADKEQQYVELEAPDLETSSTEDIRSFLMANGGWPLIRQRPFNVVPSATDAPDDVFISTFDTAPMAPNMSHLINGNEAAFQKGLDVLNHLTEGSVYLGLDARKDVQVSEAFSGAQGVEKHWFVGKHPAGNVGIQIHHIKPMSTTAKVWTLDVSGVVTIGNMWLLNRYDSNRVIVLNGTELEAPKYVRTKIGAHIGELLANNLKKGNNRIISGDVLSGQQKSISGYLNVYDNQISVIAEGNYHEPFGWLVPTRQKPSISRTFPGFLFPDNKYEADTNTHGERRAFVVTGQYEQVLPVDTHPQALMKAILNNDFEMMEGLGLHELVEEDVALCEFVCTSKMPLQKILREGLDTMREQS